MKRKIITTSDGSKTIQIEDWNEQYHSIHGAIQEANHVFIKHGLLFYYQSGHPELVSGSLKWLEMLNQVQHDVSLLTHRRSAVLQYSAPR